jgi:hypothetical protein
LFCSFIVLELTLHAASRRGAWRVLEICWPSLETHWVDHDSTDGIVRPVKHKGKPAAPAVK